VGCHQSFEDEVEGGIGIGSFVGVESSIGEDEAGLHPERKNKNRRMILYRMMLELRQVILVL